METESSNVIRSNKRSRCEVETDDPQHSNGVKPLEAQDGGKCSSELYSSGLERTIRTMAEV